MEDLTMSYETSACKQLKKHLKEIMSLSFYSCKDRSEAYTVNNLAHECELIVKKLESHCKKNESYKH
jgi:hypothetical protein